MMRRHLSLLLATWGPGLIGPAAGQEWNAPETLALVDRAVERRSAAVQTAGLRDYRATARGFVLFLTQLGAGFDAPPVLAKTDQLVLEVYWQAPNRSKQLIVGWRDRMDLPTEIRYHRDHLGIVQNSFGDRIRMGDGHEVRDVPHPVSRAGRAVYDYAAVDSVTLILEGRTLDVVEVRVRPREEGAAGVVGAVFLERSGAEIVRLRFGFTRAAYRDDTVEDITVALEHALWDGRFWLPREQRIEIRRRTGWLDFPARGIIRARWTVDDYRFNIGLSPTVFAGREVVPAPAAVRDTFPWVQSLDADLADAGDGHETLDLDAVRSQLRDVVSARLLSGLPSTAVGGGGVSDLVRFTRVEGVRLGVGGVHRPFGRRVEARGWLGYGLGDRRVSARASLAWRRGAWSVEALAAREVKDFADEPIVSPLINSLGAQEGGVDHGDYLVAETAALRAARRGGGIRLSASLGVERIGPADVVARPVRGMFRPNPAFPAGTFLVARTRFGIGNAASTGSPAGAGIGLETGWSDARRYARLDVAAHLQAGPRWGPVRTPDLPGHRGFALGGRGTLVGERFRAWGGRVAGWGTAEWRFAIPVPALGFGEVVTTGERLTLASWVGVGAAGGAIAGMPWMPSDGARPLVGVAVEWLQGLIRWELGWSIRDGAVRGALDVRRDLWGVL